MGAESDTVVPFLEAVSG